MVSYHADHVPVMQLPLLLLSDQRPNPGVVVWNVRSISVSPGRSGLRQLLARPCDWCATIPACVHVPWRHTPPHSWRTDAPITYSTA